MAVWWLDKIRCLLVIKTSPVGEGGGVVKILKFSVFGGLVLYQLFLGCANLGGYLYGHVIFDMYFFVCVSFQIKALCNLLLMYSLIKCSIFTIYASNVLE